MNSMLFDSRGNSSYSPYDDDFGNDNEYDTYYDEDYEYDRYRDRNYDE